METFLDKVLRWCRVRKLNIDLNVETDDQGGEAFLCRLRPWKQPKGRPIMWAASGDTAEEAIREAVQHHRGDHEQGLDWAYRPWGGAGNMGSAAGDTDDIPF